MKQETILALGLTGLLVAGCVFSATHTSNADTQKTTDYSKYVTLGEYKGVSTGLTVNETTDAEIQEVTDTLIAQYGGNFKPDNTATITEKCRVTATIPDEDGHEDEITWLMTDDNYKPFIDASLGKKVGDTIKVPLVDGEYDVTITQIEVPDEITDDFVKSMELPDIDTVEELKADIKSYIDEQHTLEYNALQQENAFNIMFASCEVTEIPADIMTAYTEITNERVNMLIDYTKSQAEEGQELTDTEIIKQQMEADEFVGTTDDYLKWYAQRNAMTYMICKEIADKENIEVTDDELYNLIAAEWAPQQEEYPTLISFIEAKGKTNYEMNALIAKVKEYVGEQSKEGLIKIENTTGEKSTEVTNVDSTNTTNTATESTTTETE